MTYQITMHPRAHSEFKTEKLVAQLQDFIAVQKLYNKSPKYTEFAKEMVRPKVKSSLGLIEDKKKIVELAKKLEKKYSKKNMSSNHEASVQMQFASTANPFLLKTNNSSNFSFNVHKTRNSNLKKESEPTFDL